MSAKSFSRRDFLKASAVVSMGLSLAACVAPPAATTEGGATGAAEPTLIKFFNRGGEYVPDHGFADC